MVLVNGVYGGAKYDVQFESPDEAMRERTSKLYIQLKRF